MSTALSLFLLSVSIMYSDAARILAMFPVPSISHQVVFRPYTQELAKRGHQVTVITPDPAFPKGGTPANLTEIDVHDFSYEMWQSFYKVTSTGEKDLNQQMTTAFTIIVDIVEMQLKLDAVQKILKEEKFDLLLVEACVKPALVLSHVYKVPVIQVSSFGPMNFNVETIGSAWHPLLYPGILTKRSVNLSKWEKLEELWNFYRIENILKGVEDSENEMAKRLFGPDVPTMSELKNNVHMLFLNAHPIWEGNRPVPPSVIYMGGLHQKPQKELPADLKQYLDSSKNGVIYISFGTNVQPSLLPQDRVQLMAKVFSQLPYDVLWKWDKDELPGRSKNIRISKWLPQSDLLRHPKIKLFITQGGLQSTDEAITAGVPLLGFPMLGDQWYNVEKYVQHKIGLQLDLLSTNEEEFKNAINTIINDESYRKNVHKLRSVMYDQPQPPLERAVWWTEHVLRHGGARHLRGPAANMSWAEYLELELVLIVLAAITGVVLVLSLIAHYLWKFVKMQMKYSLMRIAFVRGNSFFAKRLYGGPVLAHSEPFRSELLQQKLGTDNWYKDFHNYTLIWKPDGIELLVDNERYGVVDPGAGFSEKAQKHNKDQFDWSWNRGTIMAPFDKLFYLTLGLRVGGINDFDDGVDNKPWGNKESKAMLNFWHAKDTWFPSWSGSALKIDSVKVFAL